ncbi:hypothetical protein [Nostoc sp. DedQUE09]|uniref:hypothetical protein n=1 Tax=Nostoc sp. DedQUE09 TaxID=3075394 RepID=UPI002AD1D66A|nr:hypothetical protein [Nostoc sp. DedQUE09]MDZ7950671.1 hypothetical protein [Nostoc sp. DedQUE09]
MNYEVNFLTILCAYYENQRVLGETVRGLARALTGDFKGAITDFEAWGDGAFIFDK